LPDLDERARDVPEIIEQLKRRPAFALFLLGSRLLALITIEERARVAIPLTGIGSEKQQCPTAFRGAVSSVER
jgi:hypothetical protein